MANAKRGAEILDVTTRKAKPRPLPIGETALELIERNLPEPIKQCDPWAVEGLNLIAGRPKLGKTTLERQKLAAMAEGVSFFGSPCERCTGLFLSLEEGERLTRQKFIKADFPMAALERIRVFYEWPRGEEGVKRLAQYLAENPEVRFTVIDSLTKFRAVPDKQTPAFVADYESVSMLHGALKDLPGVCIDLVHHTRKMKSDDPIDDISGTYGLSAAVDSYMVLRHHEDGAVMHAGGRLWDRDVSEYKLRRGNQRWELVGEHTGLTGEQERTHHDLKQNGGITAPQLASKLGIHRQSAWERLNALVDKGMAYKKDGVFHASR